MLQADVLIIGSGAAGMYAAVAAARAGAKVLLVDRSLIGRGGATVMAQMTVAVAVGEEEPDHWEHHLADTLKAGRGLCDPALSQLLCEDGPACICEMDAWGIGWARKNGRLAQVHAPGHDRKRCVYVDFLNTGPAVSKTLRARVQRIPEVQRVGDLVITELAIRDGVCMGAHGLHVPTGTAVTIAAKATIVATGGLTRLYARNSASINMGGDGYALALRAGAELIDMEFVQFFPIGHLAPRLVGMDPIMWDPFRYKLGGRLLNSEKKEFLPEEGRYTSARDLATYAHPQGGRGGPRLAARRRLAFFPALQRIGAARGVRAGDRPPGSKRHRPLAPADRSRADRALPHGRHPRGPGHAHQRAESLCRRARRWAARTAPIGFPATRSPRRSRSVGAQAFARPPLPRGAQCRRLNRHRRLPRTGPSSTARQKSCGFRG